MAVSPHERSRPLLGALHARSGSSRVVWVLCATALLATVALVSFVVVVQDQHQAVALKDIAHLANGWVEALDSNKKTYYYNQKLGLSSWDPPKDALAKMGADPVPKPTAVKPVASATPVASAAKSVVNAVVAQPAVASGVVGGSVANAQQGIAAVLNQQQAYSQPNNVAAQSVYQGSQTAMPPFFGSSSSSSVSAGNMRDGMVSTNLQGGATNSGNDVFANLESGSASGDNSIFSGMPSDRNGERSGYQAENTGMDGFDGDSSSGMQDDFSSDDEFGGDDGSERGQTKSVTHISTLADDVPKADKIQDISSKPADWPTELPGAVGDGPSWIVGMHREPLWSDQTQGCTPFSYCDKGTGDRGHKFQRSVNPYVDKRRTFDPYAQSKQSGRNEYPWDPTSDPQVWGTGDCSDGNLRPECWKKPSKDTLQGKQDELRRKYDEFYPDNIRAGYKESAEKAQDAEFAKAAAAGGAPAAAPVSTAAWGGAASLRPRYVGGRPVADTLGTILRRVDRQVPEQQKDIMHDIANDGGSMLHDIGRLITSMFRVRSPAAGAVELLAKPAPAHGAARLGAAKAAKAAAHGKSASIWESPLMVEAKGLFGIKDAAAADKPSAKAQAAAAAVRKSIAAAGADPLMPISAEVERVAGATAGDGGADAGGQSDAAAAAAARKRLAAWQEATLQQGALRHESTRSNLRAAVQENDARLLKARTGFTPGDLAAIERDATAVAKDAGSKAAAAVGAGDGKAPAAAAASAAHGGRRRKPAATVTGWQEAEIQKGALRRESVEDNLKAALGVRELKLLEKEAGWHSEADLAKAERFAENLQRAIASRRTEEAAHPLIPAAARSALETASPAKRAAAAAAAREPEAAAGAAPAGGKKELSSMEWEVVHNNEVRVVQRIREEEPIVKAYEAQVKNDEREFKDEVTQEDDTLTRLRKDQAKLAAAVQKQGAPPPPADGAPAAATARRRHRPTKRAPQDQDEAAVAGRAGRAAAAAAAAGTDKLSATAAEKDLDSYFASMAPPAAAAAAAAAHPAK